MTHKGAYIKAFIAVQLGRALLSLPDVAIARLLGWIAWVARLVGASAETRTSVEEARAVFVKGGSGTRIVRKMISEGDPHRLRMIIRGALIK